MLRSNIIVVVTGHIGSTRNKSGWHVTVLFVGTLHFLKFTFAAGRIVIESRVVFVKKQLRPEKETVTHPELLT